VKTKRNVITTIVIKFGTFKNKQHDVMLVGAMAEAAMRAGRRVDVRERKIINGGYTFLAYTTGDDPKHYTLARTPKCNHDFDRGRTTKRISTLVQKFERLLADCNKERLVFNIDNFG